MPIFLFFLWGSFEDYQEITSVIEDWKQKLVCITFPFVSFCTSKAASLNVLTNAQLIRVHTNKKERGDKQREHKS